MTNDDEQRQTSLLDDQLSVAVQYVGRRRNLLLYEA